MANAITFNFESRPIHSVTINNEPWFFSKDVCKALEIDITQTRKLDSDEKGVYLIHTLGGPQEVRVISESGLYALTLRCRNAMKPGTLPHRFRKWVTREVLPSIRKTGGYSVAPTQQLSGPDLMNLTSLCTHMLFLEGWWHQYGGAVRKFNSRIAACVHDHFNDGAFVAGILSHKHNIKLPDSKFVRQYPFHENFQEQQRYYLTHSRV